MKRKHLYLFLLISIFASKYFVTNVSALEQKSLEREFMIKAPKELVELYNEDKFYISNDWFNKDGTIPSDVKVITQYVKTNTKYSKGQAVETKNEVITKEEYNEEAENNGMEKVVVGNCNLQSSMYNDCWETNTKRLTVAYFSSAPTRIVVVNTWKSIPAVKSYDTIGLFHDGKFNVTSAKGWQYYNDTAQQYSYGGENVKIANNGISISQNIDDNASRGLSNELWVYGNFNSNIQHFTASYQHAVNNISLATSKNFTFSGDGMGRVFKWNSSYSNWDNMNGVCANITSNYLWFC